MKVEWDTATFSEWERLCDIAMAPMPQRWTYGAVHKALGGRVHRAVIWNKGMPVAFCQCLSRRFGQLVNVALANRGPVQLTDCDQPEIIKLIRRSMPAPHPRIYVFSLPSSVKNFRLIPLMSPATFAQITLPVTRESISGKWRNALKKSERFGIEIHQTKCSQSDLDQMLAHDLLQQKSKSYTALPCKFTRKWHTLSPKDLYLYRALENGEIIASALFLQHGNTATYHVAHTSDRARQISGGRSLLWRAFQDFAQKGVHQVDLGLIDTENAPGLARFKLGTGAKACRMGPSVLAF